MKKLAIGESSASIKLRPINLNQEQAAFLLQMIQHADGEDQAVMAAELEPKLEAIDDWFDDNTRATLERRANADGRHERSWWLDVRNVYCWHANKVAHTHTQQELAHKFGISPTRVHGVIRLVGYEITRRRQFRLRQEHRAKS